MKKKSFLSGIGAKLALAAVALTTVVFTSCEKEEFNVEPVELSPASATIVATVYDLTTGEVLAPQAIVETITAGTDGTIAFQDEGSIIYRRREGLCQRGCLHEWKISEMNYKK